MNASRWRRLWPAQTPNAQRWVVIDVETTGLDPQSDDLLCVAALAVDLSACAPALRAGDSFEVVLQQQVLKATHDNILLHGIGWGQQRQGQPQGQALQALTDWVADSPLLAYHAAFDQEVLRQAYKRCHLAQPRWQWLDMADLLPTAFPASQARSLDQWMQDLGVRCVRRHQAIADVWATAELFLKAWPRWQAQRLQSWADLAQSAREQRWLRLSQSAR
ncbi:MAG: 3'-5' exonuclease [Betaproteobacteria bacterium]